MIVILCSWESSCIYCTASMCGSLRVQQMTLDLLELNLKMFVSEQVGTKYGTPEKAANFLTSEQTPQALWYIIFICNLWLSKLISKVEHGLRNLVFEEFRHKLDLSIVHQYYRAAFNFKYTQKVVLLVCCTLTTLTYVLNIWNK